MAEEQTVQGAAEKISGLLNPKDQQKTETKTEEPSESKEPEKQETKESQPASEGTPIETTGII